MPFNRRPSDKPAFEPRLILPEPAPTTDQGELQLPDDFAALAEQLRDDAAYLAVRYRAPAESVVPADSISRAPSEVDNRRRAIGWATLSAGLALSLTVAVLGLARWNDGHEPLTSPTTTADAFLAPAPSGEAAATGRTDKELRSLTATLAGSAEEVDPTLSLLGGASGPEREALLDLWKQTANRETGISF